MRKIILASESSRRRDILETLIGKNFEVRPAKYEEDNSLYKSPFRLVVHHSMEKAKEVAQGLEEEIVIACDTVVAIDMTHEEMVEENKHYKILGKARTEDEAKVMLNKISSRLIKVVSGLAVIDTMFGTDEEGKFIKINLEYEETYVKVKHLKEKEIDDYIKTGEPIGKAGAFAIQGKGGHFIERIDSCFYNVVGLPVHRLYKVLKGLGIYIFDYE